MREIIKNLKPYQPGRGVEEVAEECGLDPKKIIKLASNENPLGPSPKALTAMKKSAGSAHIYPDNYERLREKIAKNVGAKKENIVLGSGSDELIEIIAEIFLEPGKSVLASNPTFSEYELISTKFGAVVLKENLNPDFTFNCEKFLERVPDAEIIFLCTPNNPTGTEIPAEEIEKILKSTEKPVIVDEAYYEFSGKTSAGLLNKHPNLIVLRTFSKAYGLASLRIGYAIAAEEWALVMQKARLPFNVSGMARDAAEAALEDTKFLKKVLETVERGKETLKKGLGQMGFSVYPSGGNFLWVETTSAGTGSEQLYLGLIKNGIIIRNFGRIDGFTGEYVRITAGTETQNKTLLKKIRELL